MPRAARRSGLCADAALAAAAGLGITSVRRGEGGGRDRCNGLDTLDDDDDDADAPAALSAAGGCGPDGATSGCVL